MYQEAANQHNKNPQKISVDAVTSIIGPNFIPKYLGYRATANPAVSFLYAGAVKFFFLTMSKLAVVSGLTN